MGMRHFLICVIVFCFFNGSAQVQQTNVNGASLAYVDKGAGPPVIFIHGGLSDYRGWNEPIEFFCKDFRTIAYSRRFNYPNHNNTETINFSAESEADDLAALIRELELDPVHVVGHSFGGLVALVFATKYPQLTKSLVVSEPILIEFLPGIAGGQEEYERFYNYLMRPVKISFDLLDTADVLRHTFTYFNGEDITSQLTPEAKEAIIANFGEWKAVVNSQMAFTKISREEIQNLKMPIMLITGGNTLPVPRLINGELVTLLPQAKHLHLTDASHNLWQTHLQQLAPEVLAFLSKP